MRRAGRGALRPSWRPDRAWRLQRAYGIDLDTISALRRSSVPGAVSLKQGYWFTSYAAQQNLVQSNANPAVGWGLFNDGNPHPVKWSALAGLDGNNLIDGRENDRWGFGFFQYGFSEPLLDGLAALGFYSGDESSGLDHLRRPSQDKLRHP